MSEVRFELRHTKTWSYETRAKTRHECVETEQRQRRVNTCMCLETRHVSRDSITAPDCSVKTELAGVQDRLNELEHEQRET